MLGRLGRLRGIWLDMAKACWATLEMPEWSSCTGSPATSPPFCPRWLLVGRHMHPDPPMAGWVCWLPRPGSLVPLTQTEVTCWTSWQIGLFEASATCCILIGRPLEGGTTLFGWSGLVWIARLLPHSARLECVRLLESPVSWHTRSGFSTAEHPTSCLLPCLYKTPLWCCWLLQELSCFSRGLGTLLGPRKP